MCVSLLFFQVWTLLWDSAALAEYNHDHHDVNHAEPVHQRPHGHWTQHQTPLLHRCQTLWLFTASLSDWLCVCGATDGSCFSSFYSQINESVMCFFLLGLSYFFFFYEILFPVNLFSWVWFCSLQATELQYMVRVFLWVCLMRLSYKKGLWSGWTLNVRLLGEHRS